MNMQQRSSNILQEDTVHALRERVKELTALHEAAKILHDDSGELAETLRKLAKLIPPAWQYPDITAAKIGYAGSTFETNGFRSSPWMQRAEFDVGTGESAFIEVVYFEERPFASEGPFLAEERALLNSLADMLKSHLERRASKVALHALHEDLERRVEMRTAELNEINNRLMNEIAERTRIEGELRSSRNRLRALASELAIAEERERRAIAVDLHDHLGQALAILRIRLGEIRGNAIFDGYGHTIGKLCSFVDEAISYTRTLTHELSSPVLYDLGIIAAFEELAEQVGEKHGLVVKVRSGVSAVKADEDILILVFKAVRELLVNVVKHANAKNAVIRMDSGDGRMSVTVVDDGAGFDAEGWRKRKPSGDCFGLLSISERLKHVGGSFDVSSKIGIGTSAIISVPVSLESRPKSEEGDGK